MCSSVNTWPGVPTRIGIAAADVVPRPNCVCSGDADEGHAIAPLAFTGDPDAAFASLIALVEAEPHAQLVTRDGDYVHATWRSPFFGFIDDVELLLDRANRWIAVRSAARVGYGDLGANRARIESLRARWTAGS